VKKRWFLLLLLCWMLACTAKREVGPNASQRPTPPAPSRGETELEEGQRLEQVQLESRKEEVEALISEARRLHQEGKDLWTAGDKEKARESFRNSLDRLKSEVDFAVDPRIDEVYHELLSEVQRLEILANFRRDEPPFPILESLESSESPLDEIGAVDLYAVEVDPGLEDLVSEDLRNTRFDIPVVVKKEVLKFLDYYQGRNRKAMEASLIRSGR
jgi:hypothetical protein